MKPSSVGVALSLMVAAPVAVAALITIEPDDFAAGTDISHAVPGATLSRVRSDYEGPEVFSVLPDEPYWAATGALVFGHGGDDEGNYDEHWVTETVSPFRYGALQIDFEPAATYVDLAFIGNNTPDVGRIEAYDGSGLLLSSAETGELAAGDWERLAVGDVGEISYIIAGGRLTDTVCLDNARFIPEPGTGLLCVLAAVFGGALRRRGV